MDYEDIKENYSSGGKRFQWQLNVGGQWLNVQNDQVIESHYCHPGAKGMVIGSTAGRLFINFDTLRTDNPSVKVQRLSFLPADQPEVFRWFYRGDRLWSEFESQSSGLSSSSVSSDDIERHFSLDPAGSLQFTVGVRSYCLDFSSMTQTNLLTSMRRKVRRRPRYTDNTRRLSVASAPPPATALTPPPPPPLPPWLKVTWEFLDNEGVWTEFKSHICSYSSADIERAYQADPRGQLKFTVRRFSYTLDFTGMFQINDALKTRRQVRRTEHSGSSAAAALPRWQFQDVDGQWKDFVKGNGSCSVSSQDIEQRYQQNPAGSLDFSTRSFKYQLSFADLTQTNVSTNTSRAVRRLDQ